MATSSEDNRLRDYFTLADNKITCDICGNAYAICVLTTEIKLHNSFKHGNDYQSNVSSEGSQEDWKSQFYQIKDNSIKCKFCNHTYNSENTLSIIRSHLEEKHQIKKDTAEKLCKWLCNYYSIDNIDMKQCCCKICNNIIPNKSILINHLNNTHQVEVPSEIIPTGYIKDNAEKAIAKNTLLRKYYNLEETDAKQYNCKKCNSSIPNKHLFLMKHLIEAHQLVAPSEIRSKELLNSILISNNWMWTYFTRNKEDATCSICGEIYQLRESKQKIIRHIKREHDNIYDIKENSQENWPYSITENDQIKCDICDKTYDRTFFISKHMKNHLTNKHNLNEDAAYKLFTWILKHFHILDFQKSKCKMCKNILGNNSFFDLVKHLNESHEVPVSPEIIPASFWSFLNSAKDTATSSSYQQPIQNFDQISDTDNLYDQINESSENRSTRYAESNATSSSYQQPTQNFDQLSDSNNLYDQIDKSSKNKSTRLPSFYESFNSFKDAKFIATLSTYQQPTQNFDHSSDCDNLSEDQIDESSENK